MKKEKITKSIEEMYSLDMIDYNLDIAGMIPEYARTPLAEALSLLPHNIIDFITENYTFISIDKDCKAQHWLFDDPQFKTRKGFILLNGDIWKENQRAISLIIAHEVAHAWKRHTSGSGKFEKGLKQEAEADRLAVKWLSKHYSKENLAKLCDYKNL